MSSRFNPTPIIASELELAPEAIGAVVRLLDDGATVPFIARYRKEATGALDETQIRSIRDRRAYLIELEDRRASILDAIREQGKLTPDLEKRIRAAKTKAGLEDLYLPFKKKRRTKATIARERGLLPLAEMILAQGAEGPAPQDAARPFVDADKEVPDVEAALQGARDIVAERLSEQAGLRARARRVFFATGALVSTPAKKSQKAPTKFEQYYDFRESIRSIPSHRYLALRRGEREKVLRLKMEVDEDQLIFDVTTRAGLVDASPWAGQMRQAISDSCHRLIGPGIESELRAELKRRADDEAVSVFADNLRNLLLAAPLGEKPVLGIDPGLRTGCKCVAVDATGKLLGHVTIYPIKSADKAKARLLELLDRHPVEAIAIGNGTGGRETQSFVERALREAGRSISVVSVNEAGASVYSASETAREEFPDLDLTIRGAISIARRLQDPLAELVKIEPKAIGVGQYQHDVHQPLLTRQLGEVVETCVNHVGVELNTASGPLLSYVAGIGPKLGRRIVEHRDKNGAFGSRKELLSVAGLGRKTFEQAAGFLRVRNGAHPLDQSAVHPERYALVQKMAQDAGLDLGALIGDAGKIDRIDIRRYITDEVGRPTLEDILAELKKPGRDPRERFVAPRFREDVTKIEDLEVSMVLEGVVTNVTHFGAFVDVGVHQDGLVHVSKLSDRFVKDPREVVRVGDRLKVQVLEVDLARKRISLSARL